MPSQAQFLILANSGSTQARACNPSWLRLTGVCLVLCILSLGRAQAEVAWGVNLAGAEFGDNALPGVYGTNYIYPHDPSVPQGMRYYAGKNIRLIRVPIRWERIQRNLNGALDVTELGRLTACIDAAHAQGLRVIVDVHNYARFRNGGGEALLGTAALTKAHLADLWRRLAQALRAKPSLYGYDLMNEPHDLGAQGPAIWKDAAQAAINAIRTVDATTTIIVSGYDWSSAERWVATNDGLRLLSDPASRLVFQAHQYMDDNASGTYDGNSNYDFQHHTGGDRDIGRQRLAPFIAWLRQHRLKGFIGETSIPGSNDPGWNAAFANYLQAIKDASDVLVGFTYWAGGPRWPTTTPNWSNIEPFDARQHPANPALWTDRPQMTVYLAATGGQPAWDGPAEGLGAFGPPATTRVGSSVGLSVAYQSAASDRRLAIMLFSVTRRGTGQPEVWTYQAGVYPAVSGAGTAQVTLTVPATCPLGDASWQVLLQNAAGTVTYATLNRNAIILAGLRRIECSLPPGVGDWEMIPNTGTHQIQNGMAVFEGLDPAVDHRVVLMPVAVQ